MCCLNFIFGKEEFFFESLYLNFCLLVLLEYSFWFDLILLLHRLVRIRARHIGVFKLIETPSFLKDLNLQECIFILLFKVLVCINKPVYF